MGIYFTLVRRELGGFFATLTGYLVIAGVSALLGISFSYLLDVFGLEDKPLDMPITELFYNTFYFWLILLLTAPIITMRSFAHEKSSGTFETLMTAPVGEWHVVLAKFTAAWVFYLLMWTPLLVCLFVVRHYVNDPQILAPGVTGATVLGTALIGGVFVSAGCFASSLTKNQIIAAMLSFAIGVALFILSFFSFILPPKSTWQGAVFKHISMFDHMQDFVRGVVDTRHVVFYLSLTVMFLFLTAKVVESRRWK